MVLTNPLCEFDGVQGLPKEWEAMFSSLSKNWEEDDKLPIVYSPNYNITFMGLTSIASQYSDSNKYKKIATKLEADGILKGTHLIEPVEIPDQVLQLVHSEEYIKQMQNSNFKIVQMTGMPQLLLLPNALLRWNILRPLKHHAAGTVLACGLALRHGWAINLGGGFHHASASVGRAWCPFADISIALSAVRKSTRGRVRRVLVVDLDALQGNGIAREKLRHRKEKEKTARKQQQGQQQSHQQQQQGQQGLQEGQLADKAMADSPSHPPIRSGSSAFQHTPEPAQPTTSDADGPRDEDEDEDTFLIDMYNWKAYPTDDDAKDGADVKVELKPHTGDEEYLAKLRGALVISVEQFGIPDLVLYIAGANVLKGDSVGRLALSPEGLKARDGIVWGHARKLRAPICMLLGGGFSRGTAAAVSDSIAALAAEFELVPPAADESSLLVQSEAGASGAFKAPGEEASEVAGSGSCLDDSDITGARTRLDEEVEIASARPVAVAASSAAASAVAKEEKQKKEKEEENEGEGEEEAVEVSRRAAPREGGEVTVTEKPS